MADDRTIRIGAEDDTGKAISSAAGNFNKLHSGLQKQFKQTESGGIVSMKAVEQMAKRTGQSVQDTLKKVMELTEATRRQAQFHQQAGREAQRTAEITRQAHRDAIAQQSQLTAARRMQMANVVTTPRGGWPPGGGPGGGGGGPPPPPGGGGGGALGAGAAGALMATAGRYIGIGAALETARRGFMGYAQFDTKLRLTQNQTKMTSEEIKNLGEEMKQLSKVTGESADEMLDTFNEIREAGNFTPEEARKMLPDITSAAIGVGSNAKTFARAMGDIMRNLKIPASQYGSVMEAMSHANERYNISIEEMGPSLSRATAYMAAWGYQGEDAAQRGIVMMGLLKEATGSAAKAGSALTGILGDLGSDTMGDALGFAPGKLEEDLRKHAEDPIGRLFFLMSKAENQDLVMKAIGIQDKAAYAKLMDNLKNFNGYLKDVKESKDAVAKGKFIEEGPERAAMRMVNALKEMTNALGMLLDALGATSALNWFAKTMADAAVGVERVIAGVKALVTLDFSGMMGWEEFKYRLTAARDENDKLIMSFKEYKMLKDQRGEAAADVEYNKAVKKYEDAKKKIADDRTKAKEKREEVSDEAWRKEMKEKYPDLDIDRVPRPKKTEPTTTTVPVPRAMPSIDDTGTVHAPATPMPATPAPATPPPMQQYRMPTPEERERIIKENQKLGTVIEDTTAKLVSFGNALDARPGYGVGGARVVPIGYRPGVAGAGGPVSAQGASTGAGTIAATPIAYRPGGGTGAPGYGGSGDARVMQASYTPSGLTYSGPPGGTVASGRAGPGGSGSAYGGGTTLAPPSGGNYPNVPQQAPTAPVVPGRNRAALPPPTAPTVPGQGPLSPGSGDGSRDALNMSVDEALKMEGLNETRDRDVLKEYMQTGGRNLSGEENAWCAQFVNGVVRRAGMEGTNSWSAKSFMKWGRQVGADEAMLKGDVMVFDRGRDPNKGHVGVYTGESRLNKKTGQTEFKMIQGNTGGAAAGGGAVGTTWHTRQSIKSIRRGQTQEGQTQTAQPQAPQAPQGPEGPQPGAQTYTGGTQKQQTAQTIANEFRKAGYSEAAIAGVLRNAEEESQFKADERHFDQPKFRGTEAENAHGLFQMGGGEWNEWAADMKKRGLDPSTAWKDPKEQASYLAKRIKTNAQYKKLHQILSDPKTTKEQAAAAFVKYYERPSKANLERREEHYLKGVPGVEKYTGKGAAAAPQTAAAPAPTPAPATGSEASTRGEDQTPIGKAFREQSIRRAKDKAEGFPAPGEPGSYENPKTGDTGFVNTKDPSVEQPGVPYDRDKRREEHRKMRPDTDSVDRDVQTNVNLKVNDNQVQFARSSMRRQADREVREARWNSYSDIGAA